MVHIIKWLVTAGPAPDPHFGAPVFYVAAYVLSYHIPDETGHENYMTSEGAIGVGHSQSQE